MRQRIALLVLLIAVALPTTSALAAPIHNPLQLDGQPLSCPDPDVFRISWLDEWVAACTSDYGQANPGGVVNAAFPMYVSRDLQHWQFRSFVFPPGQHPSLALPPTSGYRDGRYWSPEVHRIAGQWVVYFGARIDPGRFAISHHKSAPAGSFGSFVAWGSRLFGGTWHTRLLHYTGQLNSVPGNPNEHDGGAIDPSVAADPTTGTLYIAYAKQNNQIFVGQLSPDGLRMSQHIHLAFDPKYPWQCDPGPLRPYRPHNGCVVEGPVLYPDPQHGVLDMFFNSASTWRGSYKVGVAVSADPMRSWVIYPKPLLQSGNGLFGPGIGAQPVTTPNGSTDVFFHVQLQPSHDSQSRYLAVGQLHYNDSAAVLIREPVSTGTSTNNAGGTTLRAVPVPEVDGGVVQRVVTIGR